MTREGRQGRTSSIAQSRNRRSRSSSSEGIPLFVELAGALGLPGELCVDLGPHGASHGRERVADLAFGQSEARGKAGVGCVSVPLDVVGLEHSELIGTAFGLV